MKRLFWAAAWLVLFAASSPGRQSIPVRFASEPERDSRIESFDRAGVLYGSITGLAGALGYRTFTNREAGKLELHVSGYTVKVTGGNPFVVITDRERNASVLQLPAEVLTTGGAFFAPIRAFVPILDEIETSEVAFEPGGPVIVVGRAKPASHFDITGLGIERKANGYLITVEASRKLADFESWLKPIGGDTWLYVTIAGARADVGALRAVRPSGIVRKIMVFQSPASVQLTFRLKGRISSTELIRAEKNNNILLTVQVPEDDSERPPPPTALDRARSRWKLDCIVIDAGHGGDDPGTIGVARTREKDVALGVALKLGGLIAKRLPGVRVVYTRTTDEFIELDRRGQIANEAGGKLFISIHCNAMPHKPHQTNGFEIYLLRPGKTENALRIAERENAVVKLEKDYERRYKELTEEHFILLTMAQSAYVRYSEQFADLLQRELGDRTEIGNNGVKQAGFYVLVGASMPNVLVETGYLSNRHDEKVLRSQKGQQDIAEAMFGAVREFKRQYEKSLDEGKAENAAD